MDGSSGDDRAVLAMAHSMWLDKRASEVLHALEDDGVPALLLKGSVIAAWLYRRDGNRVYGDVDVLVPPRAWERAGATLQCLGYRAQLAGLRREEQWQHEEPWIGPEGEVVDLHRTILGVEVEPDRLFDVLTSGSVEHHLSGDRRPVRALGLAARLLHLGLHAASSGGDDVKALEDLRRGLAAHSVSEWQAAADLAVELRSEQALRAGLDLLPAGQDLLAQIRLASVQDVLVLLRAANAPHGSLVVEAFVRARGAARLRILARELFPSEALLRLYGRNRHRPVPVQRLLRPLEVLSQVPSALVAWRRARRRVGP